jgi:hypothetical protein
MTAQAQTGTLHPTNNNRALLVAVGFVAGVIVASLVALVLMNAAAQTGLQTSRSTITTNEVPGPGFTEWRHAQAAALSGTTEMSGPGYTEWRHAQAAALSGMTEVVGPGFTEWRHAQAAALSGTTQVPGPGYTEWRHSERAGQ